MWLYFLQHKRIVLLIVLIVFSCLTYIRIIHQSNTIHMYKEEQKTLFLTLNDTFILDFKKQRYVYVIKPILKNYSNIEGLIINQKILNKNIDYQYQYLGEYKKFTIPSFQLGTYYLYVTDVYQDLHNDIFHTDIPLHLQGNSITQISVRKDNTYIGYLTELMQTPVIIYPKIVNTIYHQTEERIGSDCAHFIVYGLRRAEKKIPYYSFFDIKTILRKKNSVIQPGDVLLFKDHVAIFYKDTNNNHVADKHDYMIHALNKTPKIEPIKNYSHLFSVYEFDTNWSL